MMLLKRDLWTYSIIILISLYVRAVAWSANKLYKKID